MLVPSSQPPRSHWLFIRTVLKRHLSLKRGLRYATHPGAGIEPPSASTRTNPATGTSTTSPTRTDSSSPLERGLVWAVFPQRGSPLHHVSSYIESGKSGYVTAAHFGNGPTLRVCAGFDEAVPE